MISVVIASCLNHPEREEYLKRQIDNLHGIFGDDIEILVGFDKHGKEIDGAKCYTHEKGMGHSWNWGLENASFDHVLQTEDDWVIEIGGPNEEMLPDKDTFFEILNNRMKVLDENGGIFRFTYTDDEFWTPGKTELELDGFKFLQANRPDTFRPWTWDMYLYTNQPHMKKKDLHEKVGYYIENVPPHMVEIDMCKKYYESGESTFMNPFFTLVHIGVQQSRKG